MKKQLKKSLSLIMAIIMLMSCWVWMEPQDVMAADEEEEITTYYFKVVTNVTDTGNEDGTKITVTYKTLNGTGEEKTTSKEYGQQAWKGVTTVFEGAVEGWPTRFDFHMDIGGGRTETHENITMYVGTSAETCTINCGSYGKAEFYQDLTTSSKYFKDFSVTNSATPPKFSTVTKVGAAGEAYVNKLANGAAVTTTATVTGGKDQYGVKWAAAMPTSGFSYALKDGEDGAISSTYATVSGSGATATISLKDDIQTLFPNAATGTIYLHATYNGTTATSNVKFYNPAYTMTFDANGGKIGADDSSASDTVTLGGDDSKMYYGSVIGKSPAYRVKAGKDFKGFYSTKNADATGLTTSFSGTKFADNETTVSTQGDLTWYAAWQASPITATFVTADNQLIGTVEGRYGNNMVASNMYNGLNNLNAKVKAAYEARGVEGIEFDSNNAPIYKDGATTYTFSHWKIIKAYDDSVVDGDEETNISGDVTFQAVYTKSDAATYTVSFEDGNGSTLSTKSGYKYRDAVEMPSTEPTKAQNDVYSYEFIGWAKNIGSNFYAVDAEDKDENGAAISYTHKDGAEFTVRGDASYVPVFRMIPREYSVTFNYKVDGGATESVTVDGYHWEDGITLPEGIKDNYTQGGYRYYIDGWKVGTDAAKKQLDTISVNGDMLLTATYGAGQPAEYTINFYDKDGNLAATNTYKHNDSVTAPTVGNTTEEDATVYDIPQTIDTEDSLYTFVAFKDKNGNTYSTTATGDADYYAEYTKKDYADIHFYNYDGTLIYELDGKAEGNFVGDKIPAYVNEVEDEDGTTTNVLPSKPGDVVGSYNFTGWADSNGNTVVPGTDKFTGDTYLYAQFETVFKEYEVKFLDDDGTVISEEKYHYGTEITVPENPAKAPDATYTYDFKAWDPDVSEVCYGDATYTATYRRTYNVYAVTWLKDDKSQHSESNYIYGAKIQPAVINEPVSYPAAGAGYTWAFKEWIQCNENGAPIDENGNVVDPSNAVRFTRGMKMGTEHLYFYPVFEEVANVLTVKFYEEDGITYIGEAKIPYGESLADYSGAFEEEAHKTSDDTYHYSIEKWVNVDDNTAEITVVRENISVKPVYTEAEHSKVVYELLQAPTCTETGLAHMKCEVAECDDIDYNVVLDVIPDIANPTGQIYVGTNKWTLENYEAGIDYTDIKYVGPNTNVIVNAEDLGSRSMPWNLDATISRGVGKIDYFVSTETTTDPSLIQTWTNVYDYDAVAQEVLSAVLTEKGITALEYNGYASDPSTRDKKAAIDAEVNAILASYNANATGVLSNLNLINGEKYIIYIRVSDREVNGQSNKCYFSSGTIHYGSTPATIAVTGDGYGTKFCAEATIAVTDDTDGFTTYIDGEEVALTNGKLTYNKAGVHTITVIDKNGNKSTKTFEIKGGHTYRNYTVAATCENAGSRYDQCTLCGAKANETVLAALGHSYTENYTEKAATCIVDGYRTYVCDNNCGEKLVVAPTSAEDVLAQAKKPGATEGEWVSITADDLKHLKATGNHTYAKVQDENGKDTKEDAWVIDKAATCAVVGSKHKDCTVCGALGRVTEEIPVDKENGHKYYREKVTTEPTCTTEGIKTQTCRYCGDVKETGKVDALGHVAGEYKVITDATCDSAGSKLLLCGRCDDEIGEPEYDDKGVFVKFTGDVVDIPALGHAYKVSGDPYKKDDGKYYQLYVCANDSKHTKEEETEYEEPVAATITFDYNGGYFEIPAVGNENELGYVPPVIKGTDSISTFVGETISASEIKVPTKPDTATKKYTFSYWATKNDDGSYTKVNFPIEVKGDATYYAVYAEKYVNYTITYYKEDQITEYKKVGYRHNGETYDLLAEGPSKAEDWQYKYTFAGWGVKVDKVDENGDIVKDANGNAVKEIKLIDGQKVTIDGANIVVFAVYTKTLKTYGVTFAYKADDIIASFSVEAGTNVNNHAYKPADSAIVKEKDSKYHYSFDEWNREAQFASVQSNIYTTPNFTAQAHEMETSVKTEASCTSNQVIIKTCKYCDYSYEEEVEGTKLEHNFGAWTTDDKGVSSRECQNEGCDETESKEETYTVTFLKPDGNTFKQEFEVIWGTLLSTLIPEEAPAKAKDNTSIYTFSYWKLEGTDSAIAADLRVTGNLKLVPVYTAADRLYTVSFGYDGKNTIKTFKNVKYGDIATTLYDGATPVKAYEQLETGSHFNFSGWAVGAVDTTNDLYAYYAAFTAEKHAFKETGNKIEASCQTGPGIELMCTTCGYTYTKETGKPTDHDYEVTIKEATPSADGKKTYTCKVCGDSYEETIKYVDPEANFVTITVKVTDRNNNNAPVQGAKVELFVKSGNTVGERVAAELTKSDGTASFYVPKGTYHVVVSGVNNADNTSFDLNAKSDVTVTDKAQVSIRQCGCACHNTGIWGTIFRFFHKIIKMITGEFKCCKDPSDLY